MGNVWQKLQRKYGANELRLLMVGLDAAGKTTTLYKLKLGEVTTTIPTIGFNVEAVEYKNTSFISWDVGGRDKVRPLWRYYFQNGVDVVIFVVDSNDRERISYSSDELFTLLKEDLLKSSLLLVMANKQDLPNAMSVQEITEKLELHKITDREWHVQGTCATTGDGLYEGLDWATSTFNSRKMKQALVKPVNEVINSVSPKPSGKPGTQSWWTTATRYFTKT